MAINKVILIGNLGADPEVRSFQNGDKVANLRLATSERWKDRATGEQKEKTEWHSVAVFGGLADVVERFLRKGSKVYLEGKLQTRKWQDQSGNDRYTTEVVLNGPGAKMDMLDGANREGGDQSQGGQRSSGGGQQRGSGGGSSFGLDSQRGGDDWAGSGGFGGGRSDDRRSGGASADLDDEVPF